MHGFCLSYSLAFVAFSTMALSSVAGAEEIPTASPEAVGMSSERLASIDRVMQSYIDEGKLAGSIAMVARHGKIIFFREYGLMDIEAKKPMRKDAMLRFYSMTKAITTTAALMLHEEGKLPLDAPVKQFLPEFADRQIYREAGNIPAKVDMTVRDLMRHTSGLVYGNDKYGLGQLYEAADVINPDITLSEMAKRMQDLPIMFEPGSAWVYGTSTDVLGRVVEVVAKQKLDVFLQQRIFDPLDMHDTGFQVPADKLDRFAVNYETVEGGGLKIKDHPAVSRWAKPAVMMSGGGGLVSTARDYMRFLMMIANGGEFQGTRLLRRDTVDLMTANQVPHDAGWVRFGDEVRTGVGFGLGFSVFMQHSDWDPRGRIGEWGWGGAASTHYWASPEDDLIVLTLEQTMPYSFLTENGTKRIVYNAIQDASPKSFPPRESKVLFLGDSITNSGQYISMIDAWYRTWHPADRPHFLNLGLPSETACGLSEPDHPFPRPDVHERLDRALTKVNPDIVVACYGMNDGIYYPFSEDRFRQYQDGIQRLIEKVHDTGAKLVLMTPPPFDPQPFRKQGKLLPAEADRFAWFAIYERYDQDVIRRYADWIRSLNNRVEMVIDLWSPLTEYVAERRRTDPDFSLSSDGVHLNDEGHRVIARAVLEAWGHRKPLPTDKHLIELTHRRNTILHDAWQTYVRHKRPGVTAGLPMGEAKTQAAMIEENIKAYQEIR